MPTLVDEQLPLALQLLHAPEATQQALFGVSMAANEETQTEDAGDSQRPPGGGEVEEAEQTDVKPACKPHGESEGTAIAMEAAADDQDQTTLPGGAVPDN